MSKSLSLQYWTYDVFTSDIFHGNPAAVVLLSSSKAPAFSNIPLLQSLATEFALPNTAIVNPTNQKHIYEIRYFSRSQEIPLCGHATFAAAHLLIKELGTVNIRDGLVFVTQMGRGNVRVSNEGDGLIGIELPADHSVLDQGSETFKEGYNEDREVGSSRVKETVIACTKGLEESGVVNVTESEKVGWIVELTSEVDLAKLDINSEPIKRLTKWMVVLTQPSPRKGNGIRSRVFCPSMGTIEDQVCGSAHCAVVPYFLGNSEPRSRLDKGSILEAGSEEEGLEVEHLSVRGGYMRVAWKSKFRTCIISGDAVLVSGGVINCERRSFEL